MFASSNTFKCKLCVRPEKKATDEVKTGRNLLLEKDHLLCQKTERPEAWKNGESPRKRCWQFVNSQGIFQRTSCQKLQATWSFHTKSRTNHFRREETLQDKEIFLFQQCERRTKKLIWELGISEEYIHNLEKKKQRSIISLEFCLFILSIKKPHKSSPQ